MEISSIIQVIVFVVAVIAAAVWLKSALVKQRHEELESLASTRGERVDDLEKKVGDLERQVEQMKGQMTALQALKATEIATEVVTQLTPLLARIQGQGLT